MKNPKIVTPEEWLVERKALLKKEKELTRLRDEISKQRQDLPWVKVEKPYSFTDADGDHSLADLFGDNSQLMIYHFMFGKDWEAGCSSCSFWADNFNGIDCHLAQRDITFLAVSSASFEDLDAYRKRLGWSFRWLSTEASDFNQDYKVSFGADAKEQGAVDYNYAEQSFYMDELPGVSVFVRDEDNVVYHTYSTYSRGLDLLNGAYNYIDLAPAGRNEDNGQSWVKPHDEY